MALVAAHEDGVNRGLERYPFLLLPFFADAVFPVKRNDRDVFSLSSSCFVCVAGPWGGFA